MSKKHKLQVITGVAWYSRAQWQLLKQVASDKNRLHDRYEEWCDEFDSALQGFDQVGMEYIKIPIDVAELVQWCNENQMPIDGEARAKFTAVKVSELNAGQDEGE